MTLTPEMLAQLQALAEKATPGPWFVHQPMKHFYILSEQGTYVMESNYYGVRCADDAEFISQAHPQTVLALLAERERLLAQVAQMQEALDSIESDESRQCGATSRFGLECTKRHAHWGDHVAHGTGCEEIARWSTDEAALTPPPETP